MKKRFADSFGQTPLGIRCTRGENEFNSVRAKVTASKVSSCVFNNSSRREIILLKETKGTKKIPREPHKENRNVDGGVGMGIVQTVVERAITYYRSTVRL